MDEKPIYHDLELIIKALEESSKEAGRLRAALEESEKRYRILTESDITARKQTEKFEKIFSSTFHLNPDPMAITDMVTGNIINANQAFARWTGYSPEEFIGASAMDLNLWVHPEDQKKIVKELTAAGKVSGIEVMMRQRNGRIRNVLCSARMIEVEGQGYLLTLAHDISERRQAEEALKESEEKYRRIFEGATEGIFQTTLEGRYISMNPAVASMFGFGSPQEMIDAVEDVGRQLFVNPEDREELARMLREHNKVEGHEVEVYRKDRSRFWISQNIHTVRNAAGDILYFEGTCVNITERKRAEEESRRSEEKFHQIFMTSPDMIAITRIEDGLIADVNIGFEEITGWKREEVIGRTSLSLNFWVNPSDRELMVDELKAGRDIVHREISFRHKDGSLRTGVYAARLIQMKDEVSLIFVLQDVTDRKRMDEDRLKLEQQLFQSQKMDAIGQLAGGVAHDFNNMLGVIIGNTEMALDKVGPSDPLHKTLQDILNAGMRSADLTRQLLAFARKQAVSPRVLDLNDTVAGMLKMLQRLIGENIKLIWMPGQKLWRIRIDPSQIDQLLANLMVNARDAVTKAGQIIIETSNTICDETYHSGHPECVPGEYIILAVSDNGCGMDQDIKDSIFEPFFTTKKEGRGTGLGLATVYGIVKQNGGFINVYSEPGQGTTFRIYLPRFVISDMDAADDKPATKIQGGTETVLIVEDEEWVLNLSKEMLATLGYKVLAARRTDEAVRLTREYAGNIDLLLTDVVMPDMNGKELAERIVAIKPGTKRLYMSGYTADIITRQGILDEGIQFIQKPFSLRDLAAKVREALGS